MWSANHNRHSSAPSRSAEPKTEPEPEPSHSPSPSPSPPSSHRTSVRVPAAPAAAPTRSLSPPSVRWAAATQLQLQAPSPSPSPSPSRWVNGHSSSSPAAIPQSGSQPPASVSDSALAHRSVTIYRAMTEDGAGGMSPSNSPAPPSSSVSAFLSAALRSGRSGGSGSGAGSSVAAARLVSQARKHAHRKHASKDSPPKPIGVRIRSATARLLRSRAIWVGAALALCALVALLLLSPHWLPSDAAPGLRWAPALSAGVTSLQTTQTARIRAEPYANGSAGEPLFARMRTHTPSPTSPLLNSTLHTRHVCWIFDSARLEYALQSIRSFLHSHSDSHVVVHLVTPVALRPALHDEMAALALRLPSSSFEVSSYDFSLCTRYVRWLKSFSSPSIHVAAHCKLFLAAILNPAVDTVLFLDNDITTVQAAPRCFGSSDPADQHWENDAHMIGMGVDMGDVCQLFPGRCWPIGAGWLVNTPSYASPRCATAPTEADLSSEFPRQCARPGEPEAYQFNGGVVLLHLRRMRERHFIRQLIDVTVATARQVNLRPAGWGEQCFINNYFRFFPGALRVLPCGCNYQFTAVRRSVHCPSSPIYLVHGWNTGVSQRSSDPFNRLFFYYREAFMAQSQPRPAVPTISPAPKTTTMTVTTTSATPALKGALKRQAVAVTATVPVAPANITTPSFFFMSQKHVVASQQQYYASAVRARSSPPVPSHYGDAVSILTRTAGRARFFGECRASVLEQDYPNVRHLVVTDMPESKETYLADVPDAELIPSLYHQFDPDAVCHCGRTPDEVKAVRSAGSVVKRECARAPPPSQPAARQSFFDCFCNTSYPMNSYMQSLHRRVTDGWVLYLDDDNLLTSPSSISHTMAHVESEDDLVLWRSMLGRVTPSDANFGQRLVHGDVDTAMFLFHSKHIHATAWDMFRCGDYRTLASLSKRLRPVWIDHLLTSSNPLRPQLGGLGTRGDAPSGDIAPITIIYTGRDTGLRATWLARSIRDYGSPAFDALIHEILLVWNNPDEPPPADLANASSKLRVLVQTRNSLNHRWIHTLPHIRTPVVLNLDDDLFVSKAGVLCLLGWHETNPRRMVGPVVRRIEPAGNYVMGELRRSEPYSVVLPRAVMLTTEHMCAYAAMPAEFHDYVDTQSAHCDDILLNGAVARITRIPPLRVLLPAGSLTDYFESCRAQHRAALGGLSFQPARAQRRNECTRWLLDRLRANGTTWALTTTSRTVGTCAPRGNRLSKEEGTVQPHQFISMRAPDAKCD